MSPTAAPAVWVVHYEAPVTNRHSLLPYRPKTDVLPKLHHEASQQPAIQVLMFRQKTSLGDPALVITQVYCPEVPAGRACVNNCPPPGGIFRSCQCGQPPTYPHMITQATRMRPCKLRGFDCSPFPKFSAMTSKCKTGE